MNNKYDPINHIYYNEDGILIPSLTFPENLKKEIIMYFKERNEDEE